MTWSVNQWLNLKSLDTSLKDLAVPAPEEPMADHQPFHQLSFPV